MQIIGSLLYLVTVGVWVNENMDQPTQIGWALIVSICGKFDYLSFFQLSSRSEVGGPSKVDGLFGLSSLVFFSPVFLHDRPLSVMWTGRFNSYGPSTLTYDRLL